MHRTRGPVPWVHKRHPRVALQEIVICHRKQSSAFTKIQTSPYMLSECLQQLQVPALIGAEKGCQCYKQRLSILEPVGAEAERTRTWETVLETHCLQRSIFLVLPLAQSQSRFDQLQRLSQLWPQQNEVSRSDGGWRPNRSRQRAIYASVVKLPALGYKPNKQIHWCHILSIRLHCLCACQQQQFNE